MNFTIMFRVIIVGFFWFIVFFPTLFIPRKMQYKQLWPLFSKIFIHAVKIRLHDCTEVDLSSYKNVIYTSTHKSFIDAFFIIISLIKGTPFTIVHRNDLLKNFIFNFFSKKMKFISLERTDISSQLETINEMKKFINDNHSIIFFPEGRYHFDKPVGKLKKGILKVAKETETFIVPVAIYGLKEELFLRKKAYWIDVYLKASKPLKYNDFNDDKLFMDTLEKQIENLYVELRENNK